jgi:hypothetical protein
MPARRIELRRLGRVLALLAGAALLVWPAFLNGYPLLYSDTHAFLVQAGQPRMVWDKPWIYGPFLRALHANTTLWIPLAAQGLILSHLLRLLAPGTWRHLAVCGLLAAGSAAPWFTALLIPDIFAAVTVIALYLLAFEDRLGPWQRRWLWALAGFSIASHLAHLVIAAACLAVIALLRPRRLLPAAAPLVAALALLAATNLIGFGRFAISPYGAVFALARLTADGLTAPVLARACPQSGWHLCGWIGRLPATSDDFLWDAHGPVWTHPGGPIGLAPEAAAIVARTLAEAPGATLRAALRNTLDQLTRTRLGDTLGPDWLEASVAGSLRAYFPPAEMARFRASRQLHGALAAWAAPLNVPHRVLLLLGLAATLAVLLRGNRPLALLVLVALAANAFATGALSGPHDRYQARLAWLVLLPGLQMLTRSAAPPPRRACSSAPGCVSPAP